MTFDTNWIVYLLVFFTFFLAAFYALSCVDFAKFIQVRQTTKLYLLLFLLSLALAWLCTQAVFSLTVYRGY